MKRPGLAIAAVAMLACTTSAHASEGGGSLYIQGTRNDFAAAVFQAPGVYLRNDLAYFDGSVGARPLGGRIALETTERILVNVAKLAWQAEGGILGARYGAAIALPYVLNARASGGETATGLDPFLAGDVSGIGDIYAVPLMLNWPLGHHHITLAPGIYAPTGSYSVNRVLNTGRNQWGFDLAASYTWLHPERGHEISVTAGYLINTRNNATDYRSGDAIHVDWLVGQHFSPRFAVAAVGYWYQQVTNDSGRLPLGLPGAGGFRGSGVGIGPAVLWTPQIGSRDVSLIAKWLHDIDTRNRFEGDLVMLSAAFRF